MNGLSAGSSQNTLNTPKTLSERLMIALDVTSAEEAFRLAEQLRPLGVTLKVGMELFYRAGMPVVTRLQADGGRVFVDLKLHDIPNTVAKSVVSLVDQGVGFFNLHAQGGPEMMRAAVRAAEETAQTRQVPTPCVIGVTLLTSLPETALHEHLKVDAAQTAESYVVHLARQAQASGLHGVVCSAREAAAIRQACGQAFLLITPGIRPDWSATNDQARIVTPAAALRDGSDYLVVGRPITAAADPVTAAQRVLGEMASVSA